MSELLVRSLTSAADGVLTLELIDPSGRLLPSWEPGAHVDLAPASPDAGAVPERQYSLCGDPDDLRSWRVGVLREPASRGGSAWVHEQLRPGDLVRIGGPRNHFSLGDHARYLLIAGGIGVTPMLAMARHLEARGADWRLVYGGRRAASMAFVDELAAYADRVTTWPEDSHGLLPLDELLPDEAPPTGVYCCGPRPLLAAVEQRCRPGSPYTLRVERFAAPEPVAVDGELDEFEVELAGSGLVVKVRAGISIVEALEATGFIPDSSCQEGTCGTCETKVLAGVPAHHDVILTDGEQAQGDTMMICVGRSRTARLVLDL